MAMILFDPGCTFSFVSIGFVMELDMVYDLLMFLFMCPLLLVILWLLIEFIILITFMGHKTWANLVILDIVDFDIILGMSWWSPYHAILDYHAKTVTIAMPRMDRLK